MQHVLKIIKLFLSKKRIFGNSCQIYHTKHNEDFGGKSSGGIDNMKKEELKELENLVNTFLVYSDKWFKNGIIDEIIYKDIRKEKLKFVKDLSVNQKEPRSCCKNDI